jgi:hypothetical protein
VGNRCRLAIHLPAKVAQFRFELGGFWGASGRHFLPVCTEPSAVFAASNGPSSHSLPRAEYCLDPETGEIKGAFTNHRDLGQFETLLEKHLEKLIEQKLPKRRIDRRTQITLQPHWIGASPFRGLAAFDFEHAPIFFGRTKAVGDVLAQLRRRMGEVEDAKAARIEITAAAFVLISAMSGVGKSSLVRAGILPLLVEPGNGIALWRHATMRPSESAGDLFDGLAYALCAEEALPELVRGR